MQQFRADLHIHSRFSRATSGRLNARHLAAWARVKGLDVLGTGDFTHPKWRAELAEQLVLDEASGLYRLRDPRGLDAELPEYAGKPLAGRTLFMLQAEISSIYKRGGKVRKVHNLVYVPDMDAADRLSRRLAEVGNIESDGRPILGLDSRNLLEMVLETHPQAFLVPAHIWTPWFALFGSKSGFDSVAECFGDLSSEIFAMETGLSSDPEMNWLWSELDRFALISNSDAHSGENLGREANLFSGEIGYESILRSLKGQGIGGRFLGTLEFFPEEGKYHLDGHRKCGVVMEPRETRARGGLCPVCGKPVTVGVLHRVVELADRETPIQSPGQQGYLSLIPLPEILGELLGVGAKSRKVAEQHARCVARFGSELNILQDVPEAELSRFWEPLGEGIARMRRREVLRQSGYDGEYGVVRVFTDKERASIQRRSVVGGLPLLEGMGVTAAPRAEGGKAAASATGKGKKAKGADRPSLLDALSGPSGQSGQLGPMAGGEGRRASVPASGTASGTSAGPAAEPEFEFSPAPAPGSFDAPDLADGDDGPTPPAFAALSAPRPPEGASMRFNPAQRRALTAGPQPVLVLAGPGTGKTRTLVGRVLHLAETGIDARRILAVTFTRRAAAEMDERLATALGEDAPLPRTDTLHALAFEYWHRATPTPPVLLSEEAARRVFAEANPDEPAQRLREAWEAIGVCREKMRSCLVEHAPLLARYTDQKAAWNLADYTDLLEFWLDQIQNGIYASPWRHVLVDEIQDLSPLQLTLVRALAPHGGAGFFGIGDPDQSIYGFRGAHGDVAAFLREAWPDLSVVALEENYRSSARILDFAGGLMRGRSACGPLRAARDLPGELHLFEAPTAEGEAAWIGEQIRGLIGATSHSLLDAGHGRSRRGTVLDEGGFSPGDIAVLVRPARGAHPGRGRAHAGHRFHVTAGSARRSGVTRRAQPPPPGGGRGAPLAGKPAGADGGATACLPCARRGIRSGRRRGGCLRFPRFRPAGRRRARPAARRGNSRAWHAVRCGLPAQGAGQGPAGRGRLPARNSALRRPVLAVLGLPGAVPRLRHPRRLGRADELDQLAKRVGTGAARQREGADHEPARGQGPGVPRGVPARAGGRHHALCRGGHPDRQARPGGAQRRGRGTPPALRGHDPRLRGAVPELRRAPPTVRPRTAPEAVAFPGRRAAGGAAPLHAGAAPEAQGAAAAVAVDPAGRCRCALLRFFGARRP
jgi:uncharacterized protein (TIGR00375 family)